MVNWITASQNSGNGTTILTITAATNSELTARTASLVVSSATLTASTSISQLGRDAVYVTVIPDTVSFNYGSGSSVVRIESNGAWTVSANSTTRSWLSFNTTAGTGNGVIQLSVAENTQSQALSGTIRVSTADDYKDVSVTQAGHTYVSAGTDTLTYPAIVGGGYTYNVYVYSNGAWTAECPSWITATYTAYTGNKQVGFKVTTPNESFEPRVGYIRLKTVDEEFVITATQEGALMTLDISPSGETKFEYTGETIVFTATTNSYWTITEKPSWLTLSTMSGGSGTTLVTATSQPNYTYENKYGDLVFANDDNTITIPVVSRFYAAITVNYYIESGGTNVRIVNEYQDFESITVDGGTPEAITSCYRNISTGNHTIVFRLTGDTVSGGAWIYEYDYPSTTVILDMKSNLVQDVFISKNVRSISGGFAGQMSLSSVTFEQGSRLEEIGFCTFERCSSLRSIDIPSSVNTIGYAAFRFSGLENISLPISVTNDGVSANSVFYGCSALTSAYVPDIDYTKGWFTNCTALTGATYIGIGENTDEMFNGCSALTTVYMPNVSHLGSELFRGCSAFESFDIGSGVTYIGSNAFNGCTSLSSVTTYNHGQNIQDVGGWAFASCSALTSMDLMLSKISGSEKLYGTFCDCTSLQSVVLPGTFSNLGGMAFSNCTSLNEITWLSTTAPSWETNIGTYTFSSVPSGGTLYVPSGFESVYSNLANTIHWNVQSYIPTDFIVVEGEVSYLYCETGVSKTIQVFSPDSNYTVSLNSANFIVSGTPTAGYTTFSVSSNIINTGSTDITATLTFTRIGTGDQYPVTLRVLDSSQGFDLIITCEVPSAGTYKINGAGMKYTWNPNGYYSGEAVDPATQGNMVIDDVYTPISTGYTFSSSGTYQLRYIFNDHAVPGDFMNSSRGYDITPLSADFGKDLTAIGPHAFEGCQISGTVTLYENTKLIDYGAFMNCGLQHFVSSADTLTFRAPSGTGSFFYGSSIESFTCQPTALIAYYQSMFGNCTSLSSITRSQSITQVGNSAFYKCSSLTELDIPATCSYFGTGIIDDSGIKTIRCYGTTSPKKANSTSGYPFTSGRIQTNGTLYRPSNGSGYYYNSSMSNTEKTWRYLTNSPGSWSVRDL